MYRKALTSHPKFRDGIGAITVGKLRGQKDGHSDADDHSGGLISGTTTRNHVATRRLALRN